MCGSFRDSSSEQNNFRDICYHSFTLLLSLVIVISNITPYDGDSQMPRKALIVSPHLYIRLSAYNRATPNGRIFVQLDIGSFYENMSRNSKFG
jgi:hypothetical protein